MKKADVCIIGGGASGLVSACLEKGKTVLIEKSDRVGKKILLTGNGRCNLSNVDLDKKFYSNPDFYHQVFTGYKQDLDQFLSSLGLFTRVDGAGRIYPHSNHASSVLDALRVKAEESAEIITDCMAGEISKSADGYLVKTTKGDIFAKKVVYSCGGGEFSPIKNLGLKITATQKMLCPIETETDKIKGLDGVKANAKVSLLKNGKEVYSESGELLFRLYGVSGIAVFDCSAYIARSTVKGQNSQFALKIDFLDGLKKQDVYKVLSQRAEQKVIGEKLFVGILQRKIGERILKNLSLSPEKEINQTHLDKIFDSLSNFTLSVRKLREDSYQVVSGGVDLSELNQNLESKKYPNLFVVGESADMDGVCGGYNLHWAFLSAVGASKQ